MPLSTRSLVTLRLERIQFAAAPEDEAPSCCPACDGPLSLSQPDPTDADRLIGICDECHLWYLIHCPIDANSAEMIALPGRMAVGSPKVIGRGDDEVATLPLQAGA